MSSNVRKLRCASLRSALRRCGALSRGLPRERVGATKFDMSLETREIKLFWRDVPGFCRDIPGVPEKFEKKKFVFNSRPLM